MASDIKLNGEQVIIEGAELVLDRGQETSSFGLNFKNPNGFWHLSGPRSDEGDTNPFQISWWNNNHYSEAYLTITDDGMTTLKQVEVQGDAAVRGEISVTGPNAGFSFTDRKLKKWSVSPGGRFVWYNSSGVAKLWTEKNGDLFTVDAKGNIEIKGDLNIEGSFSSSQYTYHSNPIEPSKPLSILTHQVQINDGTIVITKPKQTRDASIYDRETYDLIKLVEQLRAQVAQLQARLDKLENK